MANNIKRSAVRKVMEMHYDFTPHVDVRIHKYIDEQIANNWRFILTYQSRGWCSLRDKTITIPEWVLAARMEKLKGKGYATWYVSHELAHSYAPRQEQHGPLFMEQLIRICPKEFQYFEYGYKQRNAKDAGVSIDGIERSEWL